MNEIEKLIEELCPEGVEYRRLGEVCENYDSKRKAITAIKRIKGAIPYYGASGIVDYVEGYIFDGNYLLISEDGANLLARSTPIAFSISGKNWVNNHAHVLKFKDFATQKLVEHYINMIDLTKYISGGTQPKLNQDNLNKIEIPLPPISIQEKIVEILDKFTALETELEKQLEAELEARRKQYEYYREKLLTFSPDDENVRWMTIKEVATSYTGLTYKPQNVADSGTLVLRSSNIQGGILSFQDNVFVQMKIPDRALVKEGDLLVCVRNGSKKLVGKCALITKEAVGMAFGAFMTVLRPKECIQSNYLFHIWQSETVKKQYYGDEGMPISQITGKDLEKISIPVPPLSEQRRIVSILDRFEALTNDLQAGLPAEIAARRQQYEFYREKLLTFKRKTI